MLKGNIFLLLFAFLFVKLNAQIATGSYAVRATCGSSSSSVSSLYNIMTNGNLDYVAPITNAGTPIKVNAIGDGKVGTFFALGSVASPLDAPKLYSINKLSGVATSYGAVNKPPVPAASFPSTGYSIVPDFIGDSDVNGDTYYIGGITFIFTAPATITDAKLYVGSVSLQTNVSNIIWSPAALDVTSQTILNNFITQTAQYLLGLGPEPQGMVQDWVFDPNTNTLKSYLGYEGKFMTISNLNTSNPTVVTTTPTTPIPGTPGNKQEMGAMFRDNLGNLYAVKSNEGTIYQINANTGDFTGDIYNTGFPNCSSIDATSELTAIPLPIEFISFNSNKKGYYNQLSWRLTSNSETNYFEVRRKNAIQDNWEVISPKIFGNTSYTYSFLDKQVGKDKSFYQVAHIGNNGTQTLTNIIEVSNTKVFATALFPNPTKSSKSCTIILDAVANYQMNIIDMNGKVVYSKQFNAINNISFSDENIDLNSGVYIVELKSGESLNKVKLVIN